MRSSSSREYRAAVRRGSSGAGRTVDQVEYACFWLCMACGHLVDPSASDPMRTDADANLASQQSCPACGSPGLADLRYTPTVESLSQLEAADPHPKRFARVGRLLVLLPFMVVAAGFGMSWLRSYELGDPGSLAGSVVVTVASLLGLALLINLVSALRSRGTRRPRPRRWRVPALAFGRGWGRRAKSKGVVEPQTPDGLVRAPISGRPCVAYEVAVRDDQAAARSFGSWRLIEQDNADFRVGEVEVARGEALLSLPRELVSEGLLMSEPEQLRRYMRMRGLLDSESVCVYETILVPGDACRVGEQDGFAQIQAA